MKQLLRKDFYTEKTSDGLYVGKVNVNKNVYTTLLAYPTSSRAKEVIMKKWVFMGNDIWDY